MKIPAIKSVHQSFSLIDIPSEWQPMIESINEDKDKTVVFSKFDYFPKEPGKKKQQLYDIRTTPSGKTRIFHCQKIYKKK